MRRRMRPDGFTRPMATDGARDRPADRIPVPLRAGSSLQRPQPGAAQSARREAQQVGYNAVRPAQALTAVGERSRPASPPGNTVASTWTPKDLGAGPQRGGVVSDAGRPPSARAVDRRTRPNAKRCGHPGGDVRFGARDRCSSTRRRRPCRLPGSTSGTAAADRLPLRSATRPEWARRHASSGSSPRTPAGHARTGP